MMTKRYIAIVLSLVLVLNSLFILTVQGGTLDSIKYENKY